MRWCTTAEVIGPCGCSRLGVVLTATEGVPMGGGSLVPERYPPSRCRVAPSATSPPGRTSPVPTSRTRESGSRQLFTRFVALMFVLSAVMTQNPLQSVSAAVNSRPLLNGTHPVRDPRHRHASSVRDVHAWSCGLGGPGAGVGVGTGNGGIASAIPLITKGRAEAETTAADVNYFLGIDATSGKLVADFEEAPSRDQPGWNQSPESPGPPSSQLMAYGITPQRPTTAIRGSCT